jgi:uncharacterized protein (DUF1499 family)
LDDERGGQRRVILTSRRVARIPANGSGSVIDLRSVSRLGVSDMGVNAEQVEEFINRFNEV